MFIRIDKKEYEEAVSIGCNHTPEEFFFDFAEMLGYWNYPKTGLLSKNYFNGLTEIIQDKRIKFIKMGLQDRKDILG